MINYNKLHDANLQPIERVLDILHSHLERVGVVRATLIWRCARSSSRQVCLPPPHCCQPWWSHYTQNKSGLKNKICDILFTTHMGVRMIMKVVGWVEISSHRTGGVKHVYIINIVQLGPRPKSKEREKVWTKAEH